MAVAERLMLQARYLTGKVVRANGEHATMDHSQDLMDSRLARSIPRRFTRLVQSVVRNLSGEQTAQAMLAL